MAEYWNHDAGRKYAKSRRNSTQDDERIEWVRTLPSTRAFVRAVREVPIFTGIRARISFRTHR
jgi:hypothetical protein